MPGVGVDKFSVWERESDVSFFQTMFKKAR